MSIGKDFLFFFFNFAYYENAEKEDGKGEQAQLDALERNETGKIICITDEWKGCICTFPEIKVC